MCGLYAGLGPVPAMVSPWYDSGDINAYVRKRAGDPDIVIVKLSLLVQVMRGLEYLHSKLIVHGDIKGGNVLVSDDGVARLSDFGLSAVLYRQHSAERLDVQTEGVKVSLAAIITQHSYIKGTCRWMAPELFVEDRPRQTVASDIWACGCLFIEVNSGIHPYHTKDNDFQVIVALSKAELPPCPKTLSPILYALSQRCCMVLPGSRLSVGEITQQLQNAQIIMSILPAQFSELPSIETIISENWANFERDCVACYHATAAAMSSLGKSQAMELDYLYLQSILSSTETGRLVLDNIVRKCMSTTATWTAEQSLQSLISQRPQGLDSSTTSDVSATTSDVSAVLKARMAIVGLSSHGRYRPAKLRSAARTIALKDEQLAERFMTKFSSSELRSPLRGHKNTVFCVDFLPDGRRAVSSSRDRTLRIWDIESGETVIGPLEGHVDTVRGLAVHGSRIASCSFDGTFRVWDADSGKVVLGPITTHPRGLNWIAYSRDGTRIATAGRDNRVAIWDANTGVQLREMVGHTVGVVCVAFSKDRKRIVSGSRDSTVRIWDVASGECIGEPLTGHTKVVTAVCFSPDDKRIFSLSYDGTIRIWDAETRALIGEPLRVDTWVLCMALSPDGKRLISGSHSGKIALWEAQTGAAIPTPFKDHEGWVSSVAFSPDGRMIASASEDKTIALWDATDEWKRWDIDDEDVEQDND
ncbi:WD40 repeat-like protein [Exidia glandulosa HHB12029]|uniref:WD40 repeat-like protein n=1 Tax=Exidia glandulosa HHB12029 TaxID=1314781 RepID=A0A166BCI4_EXIGL|nr:WD40 repeat-like protein [Exidia glandulosa HHB12029]